MILGEVLAPVYDLTVSGEYVYVANGASDLQIFPTQCGVPSPVVMTDLTAEWRVNEIVVRWHVSENIFEGFLLLRAVGSSPEGDDYRVLNGNRPIPAQGPWEYVDQTVSPDETYAYKVIGRQWNGGEENLGPVFATAPGIQPRAILSSQPNPAPGSTRLRLEMSRDGEVQIDIRDIAGRHVIELLRGRVPAGRHVIVWDARNASGRPVASGLYLVRLEWPAGTATHRLMVVR